MKFIDRKEVGRQVWWFEIIGAVRLRSQLTT
jgi:hypothetical protein